MENVGVNETVPEVAKGELTTESMNESSPQSREKSVERLTSRSPNFLENKEHVVDEDRHLENETHQNSFQLSDLNSTSLSKVGDFDSSAQLITAESASSSIYIDESEVKHVYSLEENDLGNVSTNNVIKNSKDTDLSINGDLQDNPGEDSSNIGKSNNLEKFEDSAFTSVETKIKDGVSTLTKNDPGVTVTDRLEDPIENPSNDRAETNYESNAEGSSSEAIKEPEEEWMDILGSGHLMKKVLKPGIPNSRPQKSDICVLNIIGCLEDGTVVEQHENLEINHSDNEVIQGLDFALALMDKGEVAEIKVTPRFGYGSLGKRPEIPPGANLIYNVTLLDVKEEPPIHTLNVMDRIKNGLKKKERGNWWYSRDENTLAINCYRRALDYLDDTDIPEPHSEEDVHKLLEERLKTYNNLGAAQMKISAFDAALMSVNNVLAAQPANVKALFRKAKILKEKGELQESINVIKQALSHEPESQTLQQELSSLMAAQRKVNSKQRELYKKMMGNSSNQSDEDSKKKNSKNNYKTFTLVAAVSFAVAVLGTIVVKYKF